MSTLVVIGKSGQLAWEIARLVPDAVCLGRDDIDITSTESIADKLDTLAPDAVINASAYTAVDKAESDEANAYLAAISAPIMLYWGFILSCNKVI